MPVSQYTNGNIVIENALSRFPGLQSVEVVPLLNNPAVSRITVRHKSGEKIDLELPTEGLARNKWLLDRLKYFSDCGTLDGF